LWNENLERDTMEVELKEIKWFKWHSYDTYYTGHGISCVYYIVRPWGFNKTWRVYENSRQSDPVFESTTFKRAKEFVNEHNAERVLVAYSQFLQKKENKKT